jgi:hypothetical protein
MRAALLDTGIAQRLVCATYTPSGGTAQATSHTVNTSVTYAHAATERVALLNGTTTAPRHSRERVSFAITVKAFDMSGKCQYVNMHHFEIPFATFSFVLAYPAQTSDMCRTRLG